MPDILSQDEIAAIAAYRGPVQIIPRGVSGEATLVWKSRNAHGGGSLVDPSGKSGWKATKVKRSNGKAKALNGRIASLWHKGTAIRDVGIALGITEAAVKSRLARMRAAGVALPYRREA